MAASTTEVSSYDDEPNRESDRDATKTYAQHLVSENTTEKLLANTMSELPEYTGEFQAGSPSAYRDLGDEELSFQYKRVKCRVEWDEDVPAQDRSVLRFLLIFQPEAEDGSTEDPSPEVVEVVELADSEVLEIDPESRKPGEDGSYYLLPVEIEEVIEANESAGCTGYDEDENALMVPMQGSNKIKVKIAGAPQEILQKMKFLSDSANKFKITPQVPTAIEQEITLSGTAAVLGVKVQLEIDGVKVDLFDVDILEKITENFHVHLIKELSAQNGPLAPDKNEWEKYVNSIYNAQVNVFIDSVGLSNSTSSYDSDEFNADIVMDGILANNPVGPDPELTQLLRDVPPKNGMFNHYIVDHFAEVVYIDDGTQIHYKRSAATTFRSIGIVIANDDQIYPVASQKYVFSHELGHLLGMGSHASLSDGANCLMLSGDQSNGGKEIKAKHWLLMNN